MQMGWTILYINSKKHWYISNVRYNKINLCAVVAQVLIPALRSQEFEANLVYTQSSNDSQGYTENVSQKTKNK